MNDNTITTEERAALDASRQAHAQPATKPKTAAKTPTTPRRAPATPTPTPASPHTTPAKPATTNPPLDGSQPLTDRGHEQFIMAVFEGMPQTTAYQQFITRSASNATAKSGASHLIRRPALAARLLHLRLQARKIREKTMTSAEMRRVLEVIADSGGPSDKIRAVQALQKIEKEEETKKSALKVADPALIADRIAQLYHQAPSMTEDALAEYAVAVIERLDYITPAAWHNALNRADAPPIQQTPATID